MTNPTSGDGPVAVESTAAVVLVQAGLPGVRIGVVNVASDMGDVGQLLVITAGDSELGVFGRVVVGGGPLFGSPGLGRPIVEVPTHDLGYGLDGGDDIVVAQLGTDGVQVE